MAGAYFTGECFSGTHWKTLGNNCLVSWRATTFFCVCLPAERRVSAGLAALVTLGGRRGVVSLGDAFCKEQSSTVLIQAARRVLRGETAVIQPCWGERITTCLPATLACLWWQHGDEMAGL